MPPHVPIRQRFDTKYIGEPNSGCWLWTAGVDGAGYGCISEDITRRILSAHRVSWELHKGLIPDGQRVLHRCDNPPCVNPDHLFLGTQKENVQDCKTKGRLNRARGEKQGLAKLTENQIIAIRQSIKNLGLTALEYGISRSTVSAIRNKKTWKHVGG